MSSTREGIFTNYMYCKSEVTKTTRFIKENALTTKSLGGQY